MSKRKMIYSVSKIYKSVNEKMGPAYHDYDKLDVQWNTAEQYQIIKKIGRGKYSEVFEGFDAKENKIVIIKVLKPVRFKKILREIKILNNLKNGTNIVRLLDVVKSNVCGFISFIFENIDGVDMKTASVNFSVDDIRFYLYQLLKSLDYSHSMGIIHRDVKPRNIMVNTAKRQLRLIDWGLAEFYHPNFEYNVRVATRNYKGPELLVDYRFYDYSLDMWSVGCCLAGMIFKRDPFFRAISNVDMLLKVTRVLGSKGLEEYATKYNAFNVNETRTFISKNYPRRDWAQFKTNENKHLVTQDALELLDKLMVYDHQKRLTAKEAMQDKYFDPVRKEVEQLDKI